MNVRKFPSCMNAIADCDTGARGQTCESTTTGVVVPLFRDDSPERGSLLGELFLFLTQQSDETLREWAQRVRVGDLRRRVP